ncbi:MAG TPA: 3'-5' exonuclease [Burkholderiales bacterium]|nr:3'-5' exonuclease [Burkholderiales bacterium]
MKALLDRWLGPREPAHAARWVVVDCETSGLDVARDRLLQIGAVALQDGRIGIADAFSRLLRQEAPSGADNILVHGIGGDAQAGGAEPARVLHEFVEYAGAGPLVAFHAPFDRAVLERAARAHGLRWKRKWLDVADLLRVLYAARAKQCRGLDDWLQAFGIPHDSRHDALGDAFVTAQLMQVALQEARRHGFTSVRDILAAAAARRWSGA